MITACILYARTEIPNSSTNKHVSTRCDPIDSTRDDDFSNAEIENFNNQALKAAALSSCIQIQIL